MQPDASRMQPDAGRLQPDRGTITPDAAVIIPDPGAIKPDGSRIQPDPPGIRQDARRTRLDWVGISRTGETKRNRREANLIRQPLNITEALPAEFGQLRTTAGNCCRGRLGKIALCILERNKMPAGRTASRSPLLGERTSCPQRWATRLVRRLPSRTLLILLFQITRDFGELS